MDPQWCKAYVPYRDFQWPDRWPSFWKETYPEFLMSVTGFYWQDNDLSPSKLSQMICHFQNLETFSCLPETDGTRWDPSVFERCLNSIASKLCPCLNMYHQYIRKNHNICGVFQRVCIVTEAIALECSPKETPRILTHLPIHCHLYFKN